MPQGKIIFLVFLAAALVAFLSAWYIDALPWGG
jgi:hypothetical protein